ncbi:MULTISPECIES: hypothetical protein [Bacillaceae]|uniref:hypothetical protein n=1 Tax=Bacillaceae TaxID=186817 RepID=UPI002E1E27FE|nr:hypothetical protein [Bacillus tropicus]
MNRFNKCNHFPFPCAFPVEQQGPTGAGATGATGTTGPDLGFAFIFDTTDQTVLANGDVTFSDDGSNNTPGFVAHTPGTTPASAPITINETGTYLITFKVFHQSGTAAFGLFNTGTSMIIPGSSYGDTSGGETLSGQIITALNAGDILTLRNIDGDTSLQNRVPPGASGAHVDSASIVIIRLA